MIGGHLGTMLDQMRADGADDVADAIEDAALHDYHDANHGAQVYRDCWFCYNERIRYCQEWPYPRTPERKIDEAAV